MRLQKAFTLIELLVVVAIIATLIAILLPSMSKAKETAQSAVCGSSQRQLGLAMISYAHENNQQYPLIGSQPASCWTGYVCPPYWDGRLLKYVPEASDAWRCPTVINDVEPYPLGHDYYRTYAMNAFLGGYVTNAVTTSPYTQSGVARPADTILLKENEGASPINFRPYGLWIRGWADIRPVHFVQKDPSTLFPTPWGNRYAEFGRVNFTFADGHVALTDFDYDGHPPTPIPGLIIDPANP